MRRETKHLLGLSAVFSALVLSISFIVLAIRKRSITSALLALATATGGAVGAALLLDAAVTPDSDGENVVMPTAGDEGEEAPELFEGEALEAASRALREEL